MRQHAWVMIYILLLMTIVFPVHQSILLDRQSPMYSQGINVLQVSPLHHIDPHHTRLIVYFPHYSPCWTFSPWSLYYSYIVQLWHVRSDRSTNTPENLSLLLLSTPSTSWPIPRTCHNLAVFPVRTATLRWLLPPRPPSTTKAWSSGSRRPFTSLPARLMLSISRLTSKRACWSSVAGLTTALR